MMGRVSQFKTCLLDIDWKTPYSAGPEDLSDLRLLHKNVIDVPPGVSTNDTRDLFQLR